MRTTQFSGKTEESRMMCFLKADALAMKRLALINEQLSGMTPIYLPESPWIFLWIAVFTR